MYIYKLGTECDGAQMRASDVYVPTLVALLGLCFDPSECFRDLRVWSGVVGNKSGKLWYVSRIVTVPSNATYVGLANFWQQRQSADYYITCKRWQPKVEGRIELMLTYGSKFLYVHTIIRFLLL